MAQVRTAPIAHIQPLTSIRRERLLPFSGKILVRKNQKVGATDVVAELNQHARHQLIDVARSLGVSAEQADTLIGVEVGQQLSPGDLIAGPVGLFRRVVRATHECQVVLTGNGQVLLELASPPYQLQAGLAGEVVELIADRGVIVETSGALIQGIWGNQRIGFGVLSVLAKSPEHELLAAEMDVSLRGSVVLAGTCRQKEALEMAETLPLRGLILASMSASLIDMARKLSMPLILLEGFGKHALPPAAFKLLSTNNRREVCLNAQRLDLYKGYRPEVVIPLPSTGLTPPLRETPTLAVDRQVRVIGALQGNAFGVITGLPGVKRLPNGLRQEVAEVRLESGQSVQVPVANLELLA